MRSAIIMHGRPDQAEFYSPKARSPSNAHWIPWLQKQLVMADYLVDTPEMPKAFSPVYTLWRSVFERYEVGPDTVLVGHSFGAGFLLRWLSETSVKPKRTILIAPFIDPVAKRWPEFFDFAMDPDLCSRTELNVWESDNDMDSIARSVPIIRAALPDVRYRLFPGKGHFCIGDLGSEAFPELAELALS